MEPQRWSDKLHENSQGAGVSPKGTTGFLSPEGLLTAGPSACIDQGVTTT